MSTVAEETSSPPHRAFEVAEQIYHDYRRSGWDRYEAPFEFEYDEDAHTGWLQYARMRDALIAWGVLDEYQARWKNLLSEVQDELVGKAHKEDACLYLRVEGRLRELRSARIEWRIGPRPKETSDPPRDDDEEPQPTLGEAETHWAFGSHQDPRTEAPVTETADGVCGHLKNRFARVMWDLFEQEESQAAEKDSA